ncbi:MAG: Minf_1886 family protein [Limisphaerales bacterium]
MEKLNFEEIVERIVALDSRYHREAYDFLREALDFTQKMTAREKDERERHVTGQQLLEGVRGYALREYGPMAQMVLGEWGIHRGEDIGELVFNLIENRVLKKTASDSREDFKGGYDFGTAFSEPFLPASVLAAGAIVKSAAGG